MKCSSVSGGSICVSSERRVHFNRDEAVDALGRFIHWSQGLKGASNIASHQVPIRLLDGNPVFDQLSELRVIILAALDGLLKNCRIRGKSSNPCAHPFVEFTRSNPPATQVVEPWALLSLQMQI